MKLTLHPEKLPTTAALLRHVFGAHPLPSSHQSGKPMEGCLLGVDYLKLLLAGNQKLPVLTLVGPTPKLFLHWLESVAHVPVMRVAQPELTTVPHTAQFKGLVVIEATPTPELLTLLDMLNNAKRIVLNYPVVDQERAVDVTASYALCTPSLPEAVGNCQTPHLVRILQAEPELDIHALRAEYVYLFDLMLNKPFLTKCATMHWFEHHLLTDDNRTEPLPS